MGQDCGCSPDQTCLVDPTPFPPIPPTPKPNLVIEKILNSSAQVVPGDRVSYTIKVTNKGTGGATSVSVVDNLNANLALPGFCCYAGSAPAVGSLGQGAVVDTVTCCKRWFSGALRLQTTVAANCARRDYRKYGERNRRWRASGQQYSYGHC